MAANCNNGEMNYWFAHFSFGPSPHWFLEVIDSSIHEWQSSSTFPGQKFEIERNPIQTTYKIYICRNKDSSQSGCHSRVKLEFLINYGTGQEQWVADMLPLNLLVVSLSSFLFTFTNIPCLLNVSGPCVSLLLDVFCCCKWAFCNMSLHAISEGWKGLVHITSISTDR